MSALRWILLIIGVTVIAGIYFAGRRKRAQDTTRHEPGLETLSPALEPAAEQQPSALPESETNWEEDGVNFDELIVEGLQSEINDFKASTTAESAAATNSSESPASAQPSTSDSTQSSTAPATSLSMLLDDELVVLHLLAREGQPFHGDMLYSALNEAGFKRLESDVFACRGHEGEYLAVNALKPGTFPVDSGEFATKAIGLILRLSQIKTPLAAFDELLLCARFLQDKLGARLCDAQRSSLTVQTIHYLQEEIKAYQHKHRS